MKIRALILALSVLTGLAAAAELTGEVVAAKNGEPLAARVYLSDEEGRWHFVASAAANGSAVRY